MTIVDAPNKEMTTQHHQLQPQNNKAKKNKNTMKTRTTIHTTTTPTTIAAGGSSHHSTINTKRSNSNTTATSTTGATTTAGSNNPNPSSTSMGDYNNNNNSKSSNNKMKMKDVLETLISSVTCCTMLPTSAGSNSNSRSRYDHGIVEPPTIPTTTQYYWKRTRSLRPTSDDYLITAAKQGNVDKMKMLIESCNANVNYMNVYEESPLYCACLMGHEYCVRYLLHLNNNDNNNIHGVVVVDVNIADSMGETPLFKATRRNAIQIVKLLLEYGGNGGGSTSHSSSNNQATAADIHKTNYWGDTCFMIATRYGYTDLVKYFIEYFGPGGRDRNAGTSTLKSLLYVRNRCGETPLYLARQCQHHDIYQLLQTALSTVSAGTSDTSAIPTVIQQQQQDNNYTTRTQ